MSKQRLNKKVKLNLVRDLVIAIYQSDYNKLKVDFESAIAKCVELEFRSYSDEYKAFYDSSEHAKKCNSAPSQIVTSFDFYFMKAKHSGISELRFPSMEFYESDGCLNKYSSIFGKIDAIYDYSKPVYGLTFVNHGQKCLHFYLQEQCEEQFKAKRELKYILDLNKKKRAIFEPIVNRHEEMLKAIDKTRQDIHSVVSSCTTVDQLIKALPESESFLTVPKAATGMSLISVDAAKNVNELLAEAKKAKAA